MVACESVESSVGENVRTRTNGARRFWSARPAGRVHPPPSGPEARYVEKRKCGRYYTKGNPFQHPTFRRWAEQSGMEKTTILEPFAGANGLIHHLEDMRLCKKFQSFDILPGSADVARRDTLSLFPKGFSVCITNPPWLARNVASRLGMAFPACSYQDVYAFALEKCLEHCAWVAALVPESFLRAKLFRGRLSAFVSLTSAMFADTTHPVGLALFTPEKTADVEVWSGKTKIGELSRLEAMRPVPRKNGKRIRFNVPNGNVGLIALDNTRSESIRFCKPEEIANYRVRSSCRSITRMEVRGEVRITEWNEVLAEFRLKTRDVLMTPFRGLRKDGRYRRRCDWDLARGIITTCLKGSFNMSKGPRL